MAPRVDDATLKAGKPHHSTGRDPPRTLEEWRQTRTGPPYRRMGRHVRYLRREVLAWFEALAMHA
ncbi:hypothetical protein E3T46_10970 [Cryobacterium sp. Hh11]|nr:hypothetical protein E3T46_10970 [Cryobacterium sp. Hh11]